MPDMDTFTLSVLIGDALVVVTLIALIVLDKAKPSAPPEPAKSSGKRSA